MLMPICKNCNNEFGDCQCGSWEPIYLNECDYLKHKKTGKIYKVEEHCGVSMIGRDREYFIVHSRVKLAAHYPKRLIRYYEDFTISNESEFFQQTTNNKQ